MKRCNVLSPAVLLAGALMMMWFRVPDQNRDYSGPLPEFPKAGQAAANNNDVIRQGLVANLEGMAIAYEADAERIMTVEGKFRLDLSTGELASLIKLQVVEPDTILFKVQAGYLTKQAKDAARAYRAMQRRQGQTAWGSGNSWDFKEYAFTLGRLSHPSDEEKAILGAIGSARRAEMPKPGDTMRAVGVARGELDNGRIALAPGMLPPEAPQ
jgi:hypothetical protein